MPTVSHPNPSRDAFIFEQRSQCSRHLRPDALKIYVYHGQNRKGVEFLGGFDVVITTFHTVSSIWRRKTEFREDSESIFSVDWHRIVLDEGEQPRSTLLYLAD
jgi:SNF2 family DNA or RNA helicase